MNSTKILIADDKEGIRHMIKEYTSLESYQSTEAVDGKATLNHFQKENFDCICDDVKVGWVEK